MDKNKIPKFNVNDIIKYKEDEKFRRKIISIDNYFYYSDNETYYYTIIINDDRYPPLIMKESNIEKFYIKENENKETPEKKEN
jgi:hypothetical protein